MLKRILIILFIIYAQNVKAQQKKISSDIYGKWPRITHYTLSDNGQYIAYVTDKASIGEDLYIQNTKNGWKKIIPHENLFKFKFSFESKYCVLNNSEGDLIIFKLNSDFTDTIKKVASYDILEQRGGSFLIYRKLGFENTLILKELNGKIKWKIENVNNYRLIEKTCSLLLNVSKSEGDHTNNSLIVFDLKSGSTTSIYSSRRISDEIVSKTMHLAFTSYDVDDEPVLHFFNLNSNSPASLLSVKLDKLQDSLKFHSLSKIGFEGDKIFFKCVKKEGSSLKASTNIVDVNIWSYKDLILQPEQLSSTSNPKEYLCVLMAKSKKVISLQRDNQEFNFASSDNDSIGLISVSKVGGTRPEHWITKNKMIFPKHIVDINSNKKTELKEIGDWKSSPSGRFWIYYNYLTNTWRSFSLTDSTYRDIANKVLAEWKAYGSDYLRGVAGWIDDENVLIYDRFDIWRINVLNKRPPIMLTEDFGKINHTVLSLVFNKDINSSSNDILLKAFNVNNIQNGFFKLSSLRSSSKPIKLVMEDKIYTDGVVGYQGRTPVKANGKSVYLLGISSSSSPPNLFLTKDFMKFQQLTSFNPQKMFNWYTPELINYKGESGELLKGILYKPDDFSPNKKYPIIFYCYENMSNSLNVFKYPDFSGNGLDVPSYVSNGYLVFSPDIHFKIGNPGESALKTVESAVRHLSTLKFIDISKIGIQGISWGGFLTNYIVTHTNVFAAGCAMSAASDLISLYSHLRHGRYPDQGYQEVGQGRMGVKLWDDLGAYLSNSPVLSANNLTTPLLLMHTTIDDAVPFNQAIEMYLSLRRLGKPSWLLEYKDGNHSLRGKPAEDFSIRMMQFFDHYLKGKPAPLWMIEGRAAKLKGIDDKLTLDTLDRIPGEGLVSDTLKISKQFKSIQK